MANKHARFWFNPAGTLGSTPDNAGQGKYKIDAKNYGTTIYNGDSGFFCWLQFEGQLLTLQS